MSDFTILVIDDNDDCNKLVKFILKHDTDWQILTATNGKEGIILAKIHQPEIILLDIAMPEMDGIEVYKTLKSSSNTRSIPVIFFTAMPMLNHTLARQIGKNVAIIVKPFNIMTLADRINKIWIESQKHKFTKLLD